MKTLIDASFECVVGRAVWPFYETVLRGRKTWRYQKEFEANQWRSREEIAALQWDRLQTVLKHAYNTTDYYRSLFDAAGITPADIRTPEDFAQLPILDKATVRDNRDRMVSSAFDRTRLIKSATGGSTGEPMRFCYDRNSYERRVAAAMRGDAWAGWRHCAPEFYIWGVPLLPQKGMARIKRLADHSARRRYVANTFDLSPEHIHRIAARYNQVRPRVVVGYANALYEFARYARHAGIRLHPPHGVISSAEKLFDYQRAAMEEVFGAPVFDRYGCREVMLIAAECERHAGLHVTVDNLYVEILRNGRLCGPDETGEILLTDLHNYGMPLIRYRVGDAGSWKRDSCACGRSLPLLNVVEGRTLDLITTPSGRMVPGEFFPHLLKDFPAIRRYQIVQERRDLVRLRLELQLPLPETQRIQLESIIVGALGHDVRLQWEMGDKIGIPEGSKFRPVLSHVPIEFENTSARQ